NIPISKTIAAIAKVEWITFSLFIDILCTIVIKNKKNNVKKYINNTYKKPFQVSANQSNTGPIIIATNEINATINNNSGILFQFACSSQFGYFLNCKNNVMYNQPK